MRLFSYDSKTNHEIEGDTIHCPSLRPHKTASQYEALYREHTIVTRWAPKQKKGLVPWFLGKEYIVHVDNAGMTIRTQIANLLQSSKNR